jgi:hypothetical protein
VIQLVVFYVFQGVCSAGLDTFRRTVTKITLKGQSLVRVKSHCPKGTGGHTHLASYAEISSNHDAAQFIIPVNRVIGANGQTGRVLAVLAGNRQIETVIFVPIDDMNPGQERGACISMPIGASDFAVFTSVTPNRIYGKHLWCHALLSLSLNLSMFPFFSGMALLFPYRSLR